MMEGVLPPLSFSLLLTTWVADPLGIVLTAGLVALYLAGMAAARRRGQRWPAWRVATFLVLGVGSLAWATCGGLAAYRSELFWVAALQVALLSAITPLGLALGDPVGLLRNGGGTVAARFDRLLRGPLARALMFPLVSSALAVGMLVAVFFTPWFGDSVTDAPVREVLYLAVLATGALFVLPLLGEEMLPAWCTHPVRALFACADGLLDALPGILLMTAPRLLTAGVPSLVHRGWGPSPGWDQKLGGGAMLVVAETVGLPFLGVVLVGWIRADDREARELDDRLDREREESRDHAPHGPSPDASGRGALAGAQAPGAQDPALDRPWWETDPRFADRYRR